MAVAIEERFQCPAQFWWEIFFPDAPKQGNRGLIGLELGQAAGAPGEMTFEFGVDIRRQLAFQEFDQQSHGVFTTTSAHL